MIKTLQYRTDNLNISNILKFNIDSFYYTYYILQMNTICVFIFFNIAIQLVYNVSSKSIELAKCYTKNSWQYYILFTTFSEQKGNLFPENLIDTFRPLIMPTNWIRSFIPHSYTERLKMIWTFAINFVPFNIFKFFVVIMNHALQFLLNFNCYSLFLKFIKMLSLCASVVQENPNGQ